MLTEIEKLGIECAYDPKEMSKLNYLIRISEAELKGPLQQTEYFTSIINAITEDAAEKEGLIGLTIETNQKKYLENLFEVAKELKKRAINQTESRKKLTEFPVSTKTRKLTNLVGALTGVVIGYEYGSEYGTMAAEYFNQTSHLLAPIAAGVQAGATAAGVFLASYVGIKTTDRLGKIIFTPYIKAKTPFANKIGRYENIEEALREAIIENYKKSKT